MWESLPISLLAHVFGCYAWLYARVLSNVSKKFRKIVQRKEFWRPGIQRELARRLPHAPLSLREFVDPFYKFPPSATQPIPCFEPWHYWLNWMFYRHFCRDIPMLLPGTQGWTFISIFDHDIDGDSLSFGQSPCGTMWRIIKITSAHCIESTYEESMMWYPEQRYMLKVNGATMWIDSSIPDAARDGEFAMWRGRVYNEGGVDRPLLRAGRYKH